MELSHIAGRRRLFPLPSRGGTMAGIEFGPKDQPVDIIWSHANGFNALTYRHVLAQLGDTKRVLAVDLRGHGLTTLPADPANRGGWDEFADDLVALMAFLEAREVVLAGHSLGGTSSLLAVDREPARVRKLALFEPVLLLPPRTAGGVGGTRADPARLEQGALKRRRSYCSKAEAEAAYRGRGAFRTWPDEILADYVADGFRERDDGTVELACAPEWEASNFNQSCGVNAGELLDRCPCDVSIFRAAMESTFELDIPDGQHSCVSVRTVAGTTHFLPMEQPELVRTALLAA
jgi:pimeloyl-ACP methyl ester carboxylesterase